MDPGRGGTHRPDSVPAYPADPSFASERTQTTDIIAIAVIFAAMTGVALANASTLARQGSDLGTDIGTYAFVYERVVACHCLTPMVDQNGSEVIWHALVLASASAGLDFNAWLVFVIGLQMLVWAIFGYCLARLAGLSAVLSAIAIPAVLLVVMTSPFLVAGQTNILRAGLAVPVGAVGAVLWFSPNHRWAAATLIAASALIQTPVGIIMMSAVGAASLIPGGATVWTFFAASLAYLSGATGTLSGWLLPGAWLNPVREYAADFDYITGVRTDFLAFVVVQFIVLCVLQRDFPTAYGAQMMRWALGLALPFLIVGGEAAFSDRWLQPYWSIIPICILILIYGRMPNLGRFFLSTACTVALLIVLLLRT